MKCFKLRSVKSATPTPSHVRLQPDIIYELQRGVVAVIVVVNVDDLVVHGVVVSVVAVIVVANVDNVDDVVALVVVVGVVVVLVVNLDDVLVVVVGDVAVIVNVDDVVVVRGVFVGVVYIANNSTRQRIS